MERENERKVLRTFSRKDVFASPPEEGGTKPKMASTSKQPENVEEPNTIWDRLFSCFRGKEQNSENTEDKLQSASVAGSSSNQSKIPVAPKTPEETEKYRSDGTNTFPDDQGFGWYIMPCCPCSGHLDDQPCQPHWCFSYKYIDWMTVVALIICFCWGTVYAVHPVTVTPGGALFTLVAASILAYAAGYTSSYFMRLPPSLVMFAVGFAFRNSPMWTTSQHFTEQEDEAIRAFILTIMATKAALYFDGKIFIKYPLTISLLGVLPCVGEISAVGLVLLLISDFGVITSFVTATVLANASTTVISHSLVTLANAGYGAQTGIISILMAAAPIDGMIVLAVLGILVVEDRKGVTRAFITLGEQISAMFVGAIVGSLLAFFPSRNNVNATLQRTVLHILSIMCVQLLCHTLGLLAIGLLFNIAAACATVNCWNLKKWTLEAMLLKDTFEMLWHALQPVAVISVCAMVDFEQLNGEMIWESLCTFFVSYVVRICLVLLSTHFSGKPFKQRVFMSLCWTARGLTQGIMAGNLINFLSKKSTPEQLRNVLTIFTVNTIVGNVIGALQIWFFGPYLVPKDDKPSKL